MATKEQLSVLGIDIDDTLARFGGNIDFLDKMLHLFAQEEAIDQVLIAFAQHDAKELERSSHSIKGAASNLGLLELSKRASMVCEAVRKAHSADIDSSLIDNVVSENTRVINAINDL